MPHDPTTTGRGPWRLLILDRDLGDPKWILATVATPADVRPARPGRERRRRTTAAWAAAAGWAAPAGAHTPAPPGCVAHR